MVTLGGCNQRSQTLTSMIGTYFIVDGVVEQRGQYAKSGVVGIATPETNCTGTLLTDRHVLTAFSCLRDFEAEELYVVYEGSDFREDQIIYVEQVLRSKFVLSPDITDLEDYALLVLRDSIGEQVTRHPRVYQGSTLELGGASVSCIGYGNDTFTSVQNPQLSEAGIPRGIEFMIEDIDNEAIFLTPRNQEQVRAFGGSGASCRVSSTDSDRDEVIGVLSRCEASYEDVDGDNVSGEEEVTSSFRCQLVSLEQFRRFVFEHLKVDLEIEIRPYPYLAEGMFGLELSSDIQSSTPIILTLLEPEARLSEFAIQGGEVIAQFKSSPVGYECLPRKFDVPVGEDNVRLTLSCVDPVILVASVL